MGDGIDRSDPQEAARVLGKILADPGSIRFAAEVLASSIRAANEVAPASWTVSLFKHAVRLNVGQVEVITLSRLLKK